MVCSPVEDCLSAGLSDGAEIDKDKAGSRVSEDMLSNRLHSWEKHASNGQSGPEIPMRKSLVMITIIRRMDGGHWPPLCHTSGSYKSPQSVLCHISSDNTPIFWIFQVNGFGCRKTYEHRGQRLFQSQIHFFKGSLSKYSCISNSLVIIFIT